MKLFVVLSRIFHFIEHTKSETSWKMWADFGDALPRNSSTLAYLRTVPSRRSGLSEAVKVWPHTFGECRAWLCHFLLAHRFQRDCLLVILLRSSWDSSPERSERWRRWLDLVRLLKRIYSFLVAWLNLLVDSSADRVKTFRPDLKLGRIVATPMIISRGCLGSRAAMKLTTFSAFDGSNWFCLHFVLCYF